MSKLYYRLCSGFADVGKLIPVDENVYDHIDTLNKSWFKSIYFYNEEQKKQAEEMIQVGNKERPRGIAGVTDVITNKLVFDFDHKNDLEIARNDAISCCERLITHGIDVDYVQISFSGSKGFGIEVEFNDITFTPEELKNAVTEIAKDLETFDSVVVNASRIFRIPLTRHNDSKLFKMPLSFDELRTVPIDEIKEAANGEYELEIPSTWKPCSAPKTIHIIKEIPPEVPKKAVAIAGQEHDLDFSKMPKGFTKWKYALLNGYFPDGNRSNSLIILCSTLRYLGYK